MINMVKHQSHATLLLPGFGVIPFKYRFTKPVMFQAAIQLNEVVSAKLIGRLAAPNSRVGKGISAQASHRTVRDSLPSYGSCHSNHHSL